MKDFLKTLSSIRITVVCLSLLFILTLWGTIAQVEQGLYLAQQRYFYSWFFLVLGFIPFPGAQLVMWVLFINLVSVAITRFVYRLSHIGILTIHLGLLLYFIAAFMTFHMMKESNVTLLEKEGTNLSASYFDWEISAWKSQKADRRQVFAFDIANLKKGEQISFADLGITLVVESYFPHAQAYTNDDHPTSERILNNSGIKHLSAKIPNKEPEKNTPGVTFDMQTSVGHETLLLFGGETKPTVIKIGPDEYNFILRKKRFELPFTITLSDFNMELHPGTEMARSYTSLVKLEHEGVTREILISMNNPLRYKDYTLYQASYALDGFGRQYSTLAVVKNMGRLLPYIACFVTFAGLVIHFFIMGLLRKTKSV